MQRIWAWTQRIAIDASVAGTIIRTFRYHQEGEKVKTWLYGLLSALLLFTAAIVLNIESVQQTLILPFSLTVAKRCATLREQLKTEQKRVKSRALDLINAAIAIQHDLTLVTRNTEDYQDIPDLKLYPLAA